MVARGAVITIAATTGTTGAEIGEVYAALPANAEEPPKRLVGFTKVKLEAGEKQTVTVEVDPKYLSIFDVKKNGWTLVPGDYTIMVGGSSQDFPLKQVVTQTSSPADSSTTTATASSDQPAGGTSSGVPASAP